MVNAGRTPTRSLAVSQSEKAINAVVSGQTGRTQRHSNADSGVAGTIVVRRVVDD